MDLAAAARFTERFESRCPYLYLDSREFPTTGVGHLCRTLSAALALPWRDAHDQPATPDAIVAAYERISAQGTLGQPQPFRAEHFAPMTTLRLRDADITALLAQDLGHFALALAASSWPDFVTWPNSAQIATLDWVFQCGVGALKATKHLGPALQRGDWAAAAATCHRAESSQHRNDQCHDLYLGVAQ